MQQVSEDKFLEGANYVHCSTCKEKIRAINLSPVATDAFEKLKRVSKSIPRVVLSEDEVVTAAVGDEDNCHDVIIDMLVQALRGGARSTDHPTRPY